MNLCGVHHVAIIASCYEKSKHFYIDVLGFTKLRESYRKERESYKLDLDAGNIQIELFSFPDTPRRLSSPEACGLRHLCFCVEDIEKEVGILEQKGIKVEPVRIDPNTQSKYTFFFDPDMLPIELYEVI